MSACCVADYQQGWLCLLFVRLWRTQQHFNLIVSNVWCSNKKGHPRLLTAGVSVDVCLTFALPTVPTRHTTSLRPIRDGPFLMVHS